MDSEAGVVRTLSDPLIARSNSGPLADFIEVEIGDQCEAVMVMKVRTEQDFASEVIGQIPEGSAFQVTEVGLNSRIRIRSGSIAGWISYKTDLDQPLIKKAPKQKRGNFLGSSVANSAAQGVVDVMDSEADFERTTSDPLVARSLSGPLADLIEVKVGDQCEAVMLMKVRADQDFTSEVVGQILEGSTFQVTEVGTNSRIKIRSGSLIGWISYKTDLDRPLIKKAPKQKRRSRVLDAVARINSAASALEDTAARPRAGSGHGTFNIQREQLAPSAPPRASGEFAVGDRGETLVDIHLRAGESFSSPVLAKLPAGAAFQVLEAGANGRIRVAAGNAAGWISAKADLGQPLVRAAPAKKRGGPPRAPGSKLAEDCGSVTTVPSATSLPESIPSQLSGAEDRSLPRVPAAAKQPAMPARPGRPAPAPAPWLRLLCCRD